MSIASMATGDTLVFYSLTDPGFGASLTATQRASKDGRVDTFSSDTDTRALKNDEVRACSAYFVADPGASIGEYVRWTATGSGTVAMSPVRVMRVVGAYTEGRPGSGPLLWIVDLTELTAEAAGGIGGMP